MKKEMIKHKHHIVPRHVGGSDDPSNIVELTVIEHAAAHFWLWLKHNRWQDLVAWRGLSGMIGSEEAIRLAQIEGAKKAGRKNVESGHLASIRTTEHQSMAGKLGGIAAVNSGHLASLRTPEHQATAGRAGGKIGGKIAIAKLTVEQKRTGGKTAGKKNGPANGRKAAESGLLKKARSRSIEVTSKPVIQLSLSGEFIAEFTSSHEAAKAGFNRCCIGDCCRGTSKTHKGFLWKFKNV